MNNKVMAVFAAIVMAVVGFTAVVADDSAATSKEMDDINVTIGTPENVTLVVNEGNYTKYNYVLTWNMSVNVSESNTVSKTIATMDTSKSDNPFSANILTTDYFNVDMTRDNENVGVYDLMVTGKAACEYISYTITAAISITIGGDTEDIGVFATYEGVINVFPSGGEMTIASLSDAPDVGNYFGEEISATMDEDVPMEVSKYQWYAVNLPAGLTMSNNGWITGIPTKAETKSATIFATDAIGNVFKGTLSITVNGTAADPGFDYSIGEEENKSSYISFTGEEVVVTITTGDDTSSPVTDAKVQIIKDSGYQDADHEENSNEYTFTPSGSGAYLIKITVDDETKLVTLNVIAKAVSLDPEIIIEGN